jgi:hypothetical protein
MNEADWLSSHDPASMLTYLSEEENGRRRRPDHLMSPRKMRLFACACAEAVRDDLLVEESVKAVSAALAYADDDKLKRQLVEAWHAANPALHPDLQGGNLGYHHWLAAVIARDTADPRFDDSLHATFLWWAQELRNAYWFGLDHEKMAGLLREVVPNPFQPYPKLLCGNCKGSGQFFVGWGHGWQPCHCDGGKASGCNWMTRDIHQMALRVYEEQDWGDDALGALADLCEESGCTDLPLLNHLRGLEPYLHPRSVSVRRAEREGGWAVYEHEPDRGGAPSKAKMVFRHRQEALGWAKTHMGVLEWERSNNGGGSFYAGLHCGKLKEPYLLSWEKSGAGHRRGCWAVDAMLGRE